MESIAQRFPKKVTPEQLLDILIGIRKERLTQEQVAWKMGCTQSLVSRIENSNPDKIKISKLKAYFKAVTDSSISFHFVSKNETKGIQVYP